MTISAVSVVSPTSTATTDSQGHCQILVPPDLELNLGFYRVLPEAGDSPFMPAYAGVQVGSPAESRPRLDFAATRAARFTHEGEFQITGGTQANRPVRVDAREALP